MSCALVSREIARIFCQLSNAYFSSSIANVLPTVMNVLACQIATRVPFTLLVMLSSSTSGDQHFFMFSLRCADHQKNSLKGLKDKFKEEELLKVDGIPQNKIVKIEKFAISKLLKSLIKDNVAYYEVMWKRFSEPTIE
jgi:hypothetical protein